MGLTETDEPTAEDLEAISGWTHAQYVKEYEDYVLAVARAEERWLNWRAGLGYRLTEEEDEGVW